MSIESAKTFIERMKTDEDFASKVGEFKNSVDLNAFLQSAEYDFTHEEYLFVANALTEDELDQVAGGTIHCTQSGYCPSSAFAPTGNHP